MGVAISGGPDHVIEGKESKTLRAARERGGLLVKPCPLSGFQIKAEIKGFPLMYRLFLYNNGSFRILKKAGQKFSKKDYFRDFYK